MRSWPPRVRVRLSTSTTGRTNGYYVLQGQHTFFVGDEAMVAPSGTWIFCPRKIPDTFRAETPEARVLAIIVPGGFETFFIEAFGRAPEQWLPPPLQELPDLERLSRLAAKHGVTILGPRPAPVEGGGDENPAN